MTVGGQTRNGRSSLFFLRVARLQLPTEDDEACILVGGNGASLQQRRSLAVLHKAAVYGPPATGQRHPSWQSSCRSLLPLLVRCDRQVRAGGRERWK